MIKILNLTSNMENFIKEQETIINNKFELGLKTLTDELKSIDISTMQNQSNFINYVEFLREKQDELIKDYIYENIKLDNTDLLVNGEVVNSKHKIAVFTLTGFYYTKSIEFHKLCQKYLEEVEMLYKALPIL
ncbi:hypothetical protein [Flavobacterium sp.]|uniref:hypothetical protein n=1 Tax=Flavobacterium sp. TaxID=239 RepID=UPI00258F8F08|nr:hypothetical protein [Flavobacterium sp.]